MPYNYNQNKTNPFMGGQHRRELCGAAQEK